LLNWKFILLQGPMAVLQFLQHGRSSLYRTVFTNGGTYIYMYMSANSCFTEGTCTCTSIRPTTYFCWSMCASICCRTWSPADQAARRCRTTSLAAQVWSSRWGDLTGMARITTSQPSSSLQEKRNLATKLIFGPRYTISDHLLVEFAPKIPSVGGFGQDQVSF
jgi:hypothetical protein